MASKKNKRSPIKRQSNKPGAKKARNEKTERWVSALIIPVVVIGLLVYYAIQDSSDSLTIYPRTFIPVKKAGVNGSTIDPKMPDENHSESSQTTVTAEGIVLNKLRPVSGSTVFATLIGNSGHNYTVGPSETDKNGRFSIEEKLKTFKSFNPKEFVIYARGGENAEQLGGHITIHVDGQLQQRNVKISAWALILLPGIFFLSLWVAFVRAKRPKWKRLKHSTSVLLALMFTLSVIYTIASGLNYVHSEGRKSEILSLGYAFLFQGSYVDGGPEEWIFSFTCPKRVHDSKMLVNAVSGNGNGNNRNFERAKNGKNIFAFGAPLWVILLSVIGASFTTVSLIVRETKETLDYKNDNDKFWARIQDIVQHQFLILFAPLGAVFVYQILVAGDAVNNPSTVALAALGAGPTVNFLLARAINLSKNLVDPNGNRHEEEPKKKIGPLEKKQAAVQH